MVYVKLTDSSLNMQNYQFILRGFSSLFGEGIAVGILLTKVMHSRVPWAYVETEELCSTTVSE